MKLLFKKPPKCVKVGNRYLDIDTDFRLWAEVQECCNQGNLNGRAMICFIERAFGASVWGQDINELVAAFVHFLTCGKACAEKAGNPKQSETDHRNTAYNLDEDDERIVSAFEREYGIDLTSDYVHWWRFRALLDDLLSEDRFTDVVTFRCMDTAKIKDDDKRKYYAEKQRFYRLYKDQEPQTVEELNANMINALIKAREAAEAAT